MLKEILLTDDEKDTILGLCQRSLDYIRFEVNCPNHIKKMVCTRIGLVICKVKGHVPHYNEAYVAAKGGWKREGPIPTLLKDNFMSKQTRTELKMKWGNPFS